MTTATISAAAHTAAATPRHGASALPAREHAVRRGDRFVVDGWRGDRFAVDRQIGGHRRRLRSIRSNRPVIVDNGKVGGQGGNSRLRSTAFVAHHPPGQNTRTGRDDQRQERDGEQDSFHGNS